MTYFGALQAQAVEDVARQTLDTRQLLVDRVTILAQNKLKSDLDVSFAQVALEDAHLLVLRAHSDAESALAALSTVLGYREQHRFTLADETSGTGAGGRGRLATHRAGTATTGPNSQVCGTNGMPRCAWRARCVMRGCRPFPP